MDNKMTLSILKRKIIKRAILCIIILAVGLIVMQAMASLEKEPPKQTPLHRGAVVEILELSPEDHQVTVWASGTVQPRRTADIVPQISGRVTTLSPSFIAGGYFKKGELFFEIEAVDYELAAEKSRAAVIKAEYELSQVESQARIARIEWDRISIAKKDRPNPLVLYEPQMKNAKAALASARADLKQRLLDIERTKIYAPFNCRIRSESIDPGQYVTAGKGIGVISGTDMAEVVVPVSFQDLKWLSVPRIQQAKTQGSLATVSITVNGQPSEWKGRIHRSLGEVDPKGRMIRLVVRIDDPYGLKRSGNLDHRYDLAEGLFVDVKLKGNTVSNIFAIPDGALRENSSVWTMNSHGRLEIQTVEVVRREKERILVRGNLHPGDFLVLTYLSGAATGMKLRLPEEG
jgi:RND family efflux transporter MFP subunit